MSEIILTDDLGEGVTLMTLNRAPVNALSPFFLGEISRSLEAIEHDSSVRALIITSAFGVFSAGLDLKEALNFDLADQGAVVDGLNRTFGRLYAFPKPVVAALNGSAIAGGLFFALAADYGIARKGIRLGLSEIRVGVRFPVGPLEIARAALAPAMFRRLLLGGLPVTAEQALESGLVDEVHEKESVMTRARAVARDYATLPPLTYSGVKSQMRAATVATINAAVQHRSDPTQDHWFGDETIPAMNAMLQKTRK